MDNGMDTGHAQDPVAVIQVEIGVVFREQLMDPFNHGIGVIAVVDVRFKYLYHIRE
jgi:hypothetical protein